MQLIGRIGAIWLLGVLGYLPWTLLYGGGGDIVADIGPWPPTETDPDRRSREYSVYKELLNRSFEARSAAWNAGLAVGFLLGVIAGLILSGVLGI